MHTLTTPAPRALHISTGVFLLSLGATIAACAGTQPAAALGDSLLPTRAVVSTRLASHLARDPNRALCERIAQGFTARDEEALAPHFDYPAFAARVAANPGVPLAQAQSLAAQPRRTFFGHYVLPPDPRTWTCLGTREFRGAPHLALRVRWERSEFDYVLIRLGGDPQRPITDYYVVSSGVLHSEVQAIGLTPEYVEPMRLVSAMFAQSNEGAWADIIRTYRALPERLRANPVAFRHFINAVYTSERTGSPLYEEANTLAATVFRDSPYARAYWQLIDARRTQRRDDELAARRVLIDLLDDDALAAD